MLDVVDGHKLASTTGLHSSARTASTPRTARPRIRRSQHSSKTAFVRGFTWNLIMTLTILMSFSVLALVVTARPILPNDAPQPCVHNTFSQLQYDYLTYECREPPTPAIHDVVQAIFQSRTQYARSCLEPLRPIDPYPTGPLQTI